MHALVGGEGGGGGANIGFGLHQMHLIHVRVQFVEPS